jgi:hypothetical protein
MTNRKVDKKRIEKKDNYSLEPLNAGNSRDEVEIEKVNLSKERLNPE